jgi:hypothetical protein
MLCHIGQCQRVTIGNLFGETFAFSKIALILKKGSTKSSSPCPEKEFLRYLKVEDQSSRRASR